MKKRSIVLIAILLIVFSVLTMSLVGCRKTDIKVDATNLKVFMGAVNDNELGEFYIGTKTFHGDDVTTVDNKFDLSKIYDSKYTLTLEKVVPSGSVKMEGKILTINDNAETFQIQMNGGEIPLWPHFHVVKGAYNVFTFEQFAYVTTEGIATLAGPACVWSDLKFVPANSITLPDDEKLDGTSLVVKNDIYGNGYLFDAHEMVKANWDDKEWGACALDLSYATEVNVQDFKITGKVVAEGEAFSLTDLNAYGALIECDCPKGSKTKARIRNVIAENSHKIMYFSNCDVVIDGCTIQNASDSTISIETHPNGGTNVKIKNSTIANSLTAGIVMWGYTGVSGDDPKDYVNLEIEGFLDIFNWKSNKEAKLMPDTEQMGDMVNGMISGELDKKKYQPYFYKEDPNSDLKYVHLGMIVLATGGLKENKAVINGLRAVDSKGKDVPNTEFQIKDFPLPPGANTICKTCLLVGLTTDEGRMTIKPSSKIGDNKNFYQDMYWGRK